MNGTKIEVYMEISDTCQGVEGSMCLCVLKEKIRVSVGELVWERFTETAALS